MNADLIVVIEKGQIVEKGAHDELIRQGGRYADLWSKQYFVKPAKESKAEEESSETKANGAEQTCVSRTEPATQASNVGSRDNTSGEADKS